MRTGKERLPDGRNTASAGSTTANKINNQV